MLYRIIHQVNQHLHDQLCIHWHHEHLFRGFHLDFTVRRPARHPGHSTAYDFLRGFFLLADHHPALLEPCEAENIFYQGMEPDSVLVDSLGQFIAGILPAGHIHNHFRCAHNPRKRCTQVMGNGAQKIPPVPFLLYLLPGGCLLLHRQYPIHGQRYAFQHGMQKRLLRFPESGRSLHRDAHHP